MDLTEQVLSGLPATLATRQCVSISGSISSLLPVTTGIPQGSILWPLFYTLFTNELPEILTSAGLLTFSDSVDQF